MTRMMKPLESLMCAVPLCFTPPAPWSKLGFCPRHQCAHSFGEMLCSIAAALAVFLAFVALMSLQGCATGPSKDRLRDLLSQCREANRERVRIIKEYDAETTRYFKEDCRRMKGVPGWVCSGRYAVPSQDFGTITFGEAGN